MTPMHRQHWLSCLVALLLSSASTGLAQANPHEFSARGDVKMNIQTGGGTSVVRVQAMAKGFGKPLGKLKSCYAKLIEVEPGLQGKVNVEVVYPPKGKTRSKITSSDVSKRLRRCITEAFKGLTFEGVERPASALLELEFTNTVAPHVGEVEKRQAAAATADIETLPDGTRVSRFKSGKGEVSFEVRARPGSKESLIQAAHQTMINAVPRLLDCRRRASKLQSPAGQLEYNLTLRRKGRATVKSVKGTVDSQWALPCSAGAIKRAKQVRDFGRVKVVVTFGG